MTVLELVLWFFAIAVVMMVVWFVAQRFPERMTNKPDDE